jgi:DNA-3-methyladenine glycosylase I
MGRRIVMSKPEQVQRCSWCGEDEVYLKYHDREWGMPCHSSKKLFESLILDGAQAGLSWITILKRREAYRAAFDNFDAEKIARYGKKDIERLMADSGIIRNRRKIESAIGNAQAYLKLTETEASFSKWLWNFVDGKPVLNHWKDPSEIPASTELSEKISKDLKKHGFSFVGPTIIYAWLQAEGLINDHLVFCFRWKECQK